MWISKLKAVIIGLAVATVVGAGGLVYRGMAGPTVQAADGAAPPTELEALRKENAQLKLTLKLLLEKVPTQDDNEPQPKTVTVSQPLRREAAQSEDFTGRVEQVQEKEGEEGVKPTYVTLVQFEMDERSYLRYQKLLAAQGIEKKNPLHMGLSDENGFPHDGVLNSFDHRINPDKGTVGAYGEFSLASQLLPGMFARVRMPWGKPVPMLGVAATAVGGDDQGQSYVYVVENNNIIRRRIVKLGPLLGDTWKLERGLEGAIRMIEAGLQASDKVVTDGLVDLHPGDKVDPRVVPTPEAKVGDAPATESATPQLDKKPVLPADPTADAEDALKALRAAKDKKERDQALDALENSLKKLREHSPAAVVSPSK